MIAVVMEDVCLALVIVTQDMVVKIVQLPLNVQSLLVLMELLVNVVVMENVFMVNVSVILDFLVLIVQPEFHVKTIVIIMVCVLMVLVFVLVDIKEDLAKKCLRHQDQIIKQLLPMVVLMDAQDMVNAWVMEHVIVMQDSEV